MKSSQEGLRVTQSDSRVTPPSEALQSTESTKSNQSDCIYKEEILNVLRKQPAQLGTVLALIGRRPEWPAIEASINTLLAAGVIAWDEGNVHLIIAT